MNNNALTSSTPSLTSSLRETDAPRGIATAATVMITIPTVLFISVILTFVLIAAYSAYKKRKYRKIDVTDPEYAIITDNKAEEDLEMTPIKVPEREHKYGTENESRLQLLPNKNDQSTSNRKKIIRSFDSLQSNLQQPVISASCSNRPTARLPTMISPPSHIQPIGLLPRKSAPHILTGVHEGCGIIEPALEIPKKAPNMDTFEEVKSLGMPASGSSVQVPPRRHDAAIGPFRITRKSKFEIRFKKNNMPFFYKRTAKVVPNESGRLDFIAPVSSSSNKYHRLYYRHLPQQLFAELAPWTEESVPHINEVQDGDPSIPNLSGITCQRGPPIKQVSTRFEGRVSSDVPETSMQKSHSIVLPMGSTKSDSIVPPMGSTDDSTEFYYSKVRSVSSDVDVDSAQSLSRIHLPHIDPSPRKYSETQLAQIKDFADKYFMGLSTSTMVDTEGSSYQLQVSDFPQDSAASILPAKRKVGTAQRLIKVHFPPLKEDLEQTNSVILQAGVRNTAHLSATDTVLTTAIRNTMHTTAIRDPAQTAANRDNAHTTPILDSATVISKDAAHTTVKDLMPGGVNITQISSMVKHLVSSTESESEASAKNYRSHYETKNYQSSYKTDGRITIPKLDSKKQSYSYPKSPSIVKRWSPNATDDENMNDTDTNADTAYVIQSVIEDCESNFDSQQDDNEILEQYDRKEGQIYEKTIADPLSSTKAEYNDSDIPSLSSYWQEHKTSIGSRSTNRNAGDDAEIASIETQRVELSIQNNSKEVGKSGTRLENNSADILSRSTYLHELRTSTDINTPKSGSVIQQGSVEVNEPSTMTLGSNADVPSVSTYFQERTTSAGTHSSVKSSVDRHINAIASVYVQGPQSAIKKNARVESKIYTSSDTDIPSVSTYLQERKTLAGMYSTDKSQADYHGAEIASVDTVRPKSSNQKNSKRVLFEGSQGSYESDALLRNDHEGYKAASSTSWRGPDERELSSPEGGWENRRRRNNGSPEEYKLSKKMSTIPIMVVEDAIRYDPLHKRDSQLLRAESELEESEEMD